MAGKGKRNSRVPENETEEQKLKRLAGLRVSAAIWRIRLVGNLANYNPNPKQVSEIIAAMKREVAEVEKRLAVSDNKAGKAEQAFSLSA